jgi:hypothetical protein
MICDPGNHTFADFPHELSCITHLGCNFAGSPAMRKKNWKKDFKDIFHHFENS